ncbi:MAG: hypothetical protein CAPSK01_000773 [Candidatus Accumulibacter vicinus]|uniref:Uncharacterized protein n=1 Tax=Candidatus Accumulibacter vicinus TaxID=2954382 RepID=A0A084Y466_9PROT|nr:MAG: hypothetical protein CAPSK01_000773 [Candidatus Accumulibacter vicinus]
MTKYDKICRSGYQLARMLGRTQKRMMEGHCETFPGEIRSLVVTMGPVDGMLAGSSAGTGNGQEGIR